MRVATVIVCSALSLGESAERLTTACSSAASVLKRCAVATEALHSAGVMEKEPVCARRAKKAAEPLGTRFCVGQST